MSDLNREVLEHIGYVRDDIKEVNARLDTLNGRTRTVENKVAVLEDWRARIAKAHAEDADDDGVTGAITARDVKVATWVLSGIGGAALFVWQVLPMLAKLIRP